MYFTHFNHYPYVDLRPYQSVVSSCWVCGPSSHIVSAGPCVLASNSENSNCPCTGVCTQHQGQSSVGNPRYEGKNRHFIGSFAYNISVSLDPTPFWSNTSWIAYCMGGLHIFCIPAIMALFCLTTLEGFVIHHHNGHFCFKELVFNFHWNHGTEILSTIVLYLISIMISRYWSSVLSFLFLTCTPSMSFTSSSSSISTPSYTSSPYTSSALTSSITSFSLCTDFALNNRCC